MPELPEVEVSRRGLLPHLPGQHIVDVVFRAPRLRHALPPELPARLRGLRIKEIQRRGKYLLFACASTDGGGWLILHLGMSGSLRLVPPDTPAQKHDHIDLIFAHSVLRFRDPRRFGTLLWHESPTYAEHPLLAGLGIEPLSPEFNGNWIFAASRWRRTPIKTFLMDSHRIVGIGNIYAAESLFRAGISPLRPAGRLSRGACHALATAIRTTLTEAIKAGGSSVRDYVQSNGGAGSFQLTCAVYGRAGQACPTCGRAIRSLRQGGRSTFFCAHCQH